MENPTTGRVEIVPLESQYFECDCHSSEHTLRFAWDDEDNYIYTEVYLNQYRTFFKRLWVAIKYVFGYTSRYGHWDCFVLQSKDARRLKLLLEKIEQQ